eukprot:TRINITY_DN9563_c1_g1_i1.p2 TRINITY_DN9563_c1_g1~~TRINITY_DN9563_c1_g1_i1.p2  ORF type:complete len:102 (+),score=22.86 TRINITY_DN9563_c1_g1_i1:164-469(+)
MKPMWSATHRNSSLVFVSHLSVKSNSVQSLKLKKRIVTVKHNHQLGKKDMKFNSWCKPVRVDPETFKVTIPVINENGEEQQVEVLSEPAKTLPLTQRYFVF